MTPGVLYNQHCARDRPMLEMRVGGCGWTHDEAHEGDAGRNIKLKPPI